MKLTEYVVFFQLPAGCYELHTEVYAHTTAEAIEAIANGETGEIGFSGRGAGKYMIVPASRVVYLDVDETPSFRVRKEKDAD